MNQHVMIDIETLGTKPGCVVLSIGACVFDPATGETARTFETSICPESSGAKGLTADPVTVAWWMHQSDEARARAFAGIWTLTDALDHLNAWLGAMVCDLNLIVWAKPITFDPPILEAAFHACGRKEPWGFRDLRDVRTIMDAAAIGNDSVPFDGIRHSPLADAMHQCALVGLASRKLGITTYG